jgi:hypothetical protein
VVERLGLIVAAVPALTGIAVAKTEATATRDALKTTREQLATAQKQLKIARTARLPIG